MSRTRCRSRRRCCKRSANCSRSRHRQIAMDFRLPEIGEGLYDAELVRWLVKPGDAVKHGQTLMEVLTDKATMEVPSPFAGTVTALSAQPGQRVKVGDVM